MFLRRAVLCLGLVVGSLSAAATGDPTSAKRPKEALQAFNDLIGSWRCTGQPEGSRTAKQRDFWTETQSWEWQFKGDDAWLEVAFDKGKHYAKGELRYLPAKDVFQLTLRTTKDETHTFTGPFRDKRLTVDRTDPQTGEAQRLTVSLLHNNRFLYRYEVKPAGRPQFTRLYQVGATKEGVAFAQGEVGPECVVSGGLGTSKVMYMGKTYYVCCSGCRRAFQDDPAKYVKEFEAKQRK
jgi:hypothetical protein